MLFLQIILWVLLLASVLLLIGVILLQEGKGGGLAEAFGGVGAETFGVKAAGINKFTAGVGAVFFLLCIALTWTQSRPSDKPIAPDMIQAPRGASPFQVPGLPPDGPGRGAPPDDPGSGTPGGGGGGGANQGGSGDRGPDGG